MLQAESLAAFRGERLVFRNVSFAVPPGGALLLKGRNGSGKSTLLRVIAGLVRIAAGRLLWEGKNALTDFGAHAARIVYVGHQDAIKPNLTVAENLYFAAACAGRRSVTDALDRVGLAALGDLPARMLSGGQQRRLALARLALSAAPLWLLDEPSVGLDAEAVNQLGTLLAAHRSRGGIIVASTHLPLPVPGSAEMLLG